MRKGRSLKVTAAALALASAMSTAGPSRLPLGGILAGSLLTAGLIAGGIFLVRTRKK